MVIGEKIKKIFNWKIYLKNYPELFHDGVNDEKKALEHWVNHGKSENRIAHIYLEDVNFDWILYINNYSDLFHSGINSERLAIEHWITHGKKENRVCDKNIIGFMNDYANGLIMENSNNNNFKKPLNKKGDRVGGDPFLFREFCLKNLDMLRLVEIPILPITSDFEAVFIEYKCFPHVEFIIRNAIYRLGSKWSYKVICGNLNYQFMVKMCNTISSSIHVIQTNYDTMNETQYNRLLSSVHFWNLLHGKKILVYKKDSFIFNNNVDDFLQWDYISAPFPKNQKNTPENIGNGGFSLRTRQVMIDVIRNRDIHKVQFDSVVLKYMIRYGVECPPEDLYFSKMIEELRIGRVADKKTSIFFSSNFLFNKDCFGGYKFWISNNDWLAQLNNIVKIDGYQYGSNIDKYVNYVKAVMKESNLPITKVDLPKLYTRKNHFDIDFNFYLLSNRLDPSIHICNHFHDCGIYGLIYHPKQLKNIYPDVEFYSFLDTIFIKKNNCFYPSQIFMEKFVYNKSFDDFQNILVRKEHDSMSCDVSNLLIMVFVGNETIGLDLLEKLKNYRQYHTALNIAFCLNCNENFHHLRGEISKNFRYYSIYVSNEMGTDITPTMLMYSSIRKTHHGFQHVIKLQTKSVSEAYNDLTNFLLNKPLDLLVSMKKTDSNCVGNPLYYASVHPKDDVFNQLLIQRHKPYIRLHFKFVKGTIFYCETRVFDVVLNFIANNNNHLSYLLNNLYENNSVNYDNSPIHHIERLFGIIRA
jgi:hypothetical protein